ncbi:hypothetical protein JCGZ_10889 [Jatropha curcas]|uniref:Uncharacterized protein n=1 Tax=Jatropha curcas TaxID=180498 RepID=A0A067KS99_JATCU|nr:hypothetical protein JCGZ_10889 [Jatropha curcas]
MSKKTGGATGGAGTASGGAAAASGGLEWRQEGLERPANRGEERRRGEERKKKKEGGGRLAFKALIIATDKSVANRAIGNGKSEEITMKALVTMKSIARFEGYYYFRDRKGNAEGHPIVVVEDDADDVKTEEEGEEHPSPILELESKLEEEDPTGYFEDSQLPEEPHYEEDPKENLEKESLLMHLKEFQPPALRTKKQHWHVLTVKRRRMGRLVATLF